MSYVLRDYQQKASDAAVKFFNDKKANYNAVMVLPTGAGKSLIIADIASRLDGNTLVFQPSKEILQQNFQKLCSYGVLDCSVYSASLNSKEISRITFATIGSVKSNPNLFKGFKNIIVDECFPYKQFISTECGKMRIGYLYKLFCEGKKLPTVLSYDEKTGNLMPNRIISVMNNGIKDVYKYKFSGSFSIKTTDNHPFLTDNGWKSAKDIMVGDAILSAYPDGSHLKMPNDDQIEFLLGSLIGDGSLDKTRNIINANRFRFIQGEKQKDYLMWKSSILNCESKVRRIECNGFASTPAYRFSSEVIYMQDRMCTKEYAIKNLSLKSLAVIYMDDGHLDIKQNQATICCVAESETLTLLLSSKLKNYGIDNIACKSHSSFSRREYNYIRIRNKGIRRMCQLIARYVHPSMVYKIIDEYKDKVGTYQWNSNFKKYGCNIFLGREYSGRENVYNMEIENAHTYIITSSKYNKNKKEFDNGLIVHNCHGVNPKQGMYKEFFKVIQCKVLGLTATPYRLKSYRDQGSFLQILTRCRGAIFKKIIYSVQISTLLDMGYLAKLKYYSLKAPDFNLNNLKLNTTKADYTDKSVQKEYERIDFYSWIVSIVKRLINPCKGRKPHGILVFTRFVKEAKMLSETIPCCEYVSGETPKKERERIIEGFKDGTIKVVANAGVLVCGFDYPALDTIVLACPTMSLARYYQEVGRAIRPYPGKDGWLVDLCGTFDKFGKVEDLKLHDASGRGKWDVYSNGTRLTSRFFA